MKLTSRVAIWSAFLLAWIILSSLLFISISNHNYLQIFQFPGWQKYLTTLGRIHPATYIWDLFRSWAGALLFSLVCLFLGLGILGKLRIQGPHLAIGVTAFALGEIIFSIFDLTIISVFKLTPQIVTASIIAGSFVGLQSFAVFIHGISFAKKKIDLGSADKFILGLIVAVIASGALLSAARLSYDSVSEYFTHAKIMAMSQTAVYTFPRDPFLISSFHPGILFTALIELFGDQSARMLSWVNGVAILATGLAISKELSLTTRSRLWFMAFMCTSTAFIDLLGDGKIELISTLPLVAALYWMLKSIQAPDKRAFGLIGILIGFAMICRPYNIFLMSCFLAIFYSAYIFLKRREPQFDLAKFFQTAIWILLPVAFLAVFHLWQNWLWLGNPIAPLAARKLLNVSAWQWQFDPEYLNFYRAIYPFTVSFMNSPQSLGSVSPFFIGILPIIFLGKIRSALRERTELLLLTLASIITLALWITFFYTVVEIRYVLFLWVFLFLVLGQIADTAIEQTRWPIGALLQPLMALLLVYILIRTVVIALGTYSPIDSNGKPNCYDINLCTFLDPLNNTAKQGDRVLVLNAYRYYLRPDLFACSSRAQEYPTLESLAKQNSPDFWAEAYRRGFQYVTYETNYAVFHSHFGKIPSVDAAPDWLHVSEISSTPDGLEKIYRIEAISDPPIHPQEFCEKDPSGIWRVKFASPLGQQ